MEVRRLFFDNLLQGLAGTLCALAVPLAIQFPDAAPYITVVAGGMERQAKALEKANGCVLVCKRGVWDCWEHKECASVKDGALQPPEQSTNRAA